MPPLIGDICPVYIQKMTSWYTNVYFAQKSFHTYFDLKFMKRAIWIMTKESLFAQNAQRIPSENFQHTIVLELMRDRFMGQSQKIQIDLSSHLKVNKNGQMKIGKSIELSMTVDGQLNPQWVEWVMGFPTGWTGLKD